jgi:hypothetical protein
MEYLIDKVLFPHLVKEDDEQERQFYGKQGSRSSTNSGDIEDDDVDTNGRKLTRSGVATEDQTLGMRHV